MARKKIAKRVKSTKPVTVESRIEALLSLYHDILRIISSQTRHANGQFVLITQYLDRIEAKLVHMHGEQGEKIEQSPPPFTTEQFEQLRMAVNKIAAYAAAMDETKKTMIKLTSERISKLDERVTKLRVRLKRLKG